MAMPPELIETPEETTVIGDLDGDLGSANIVCLPGGEHGDCWGRRIKPGGKNGYEYADVCI